MAITARTCFNPRTPCGVRPVTPGAIRRTYRFQSTHSLRSATLTAQTHPQQGDVSIHALLAECDCRTFWPPARLTCFNPRTPCGVRPIHLKQRLFCPPVSIHALLAECDLVSYFTVNQLCSFNPRTPCGVRLRLTIYIVIQQRKRYFAPTSRRRPSSPSLLF